jgi:hypothetical protein
MSSLRFLSSRVLCCVGAVLVALAVITAGPRAGLAEPGEPSDETGDQAGDDAGDDAPAEDGEEPDGSDTGGLTDEQRAEIEAELSALSPAELEAAAYAFERRDKPRSATLVREHLARRFDAELTELDAARTAVAAHDADEAAKSAATAVLAERAATVQRRQADNAKWLRILKSDGGRQMLGDLRTARYIRRERLADVDDMRAAVDKNERLQRFAKAHTERRRMRIEAKRLAMFVEMKIERLEKTRKLISRMSKYEGTGAVEKFDREIAFFKGVKTEVDALVARISAEVEAAESAPANARRAAGLRLLAELAESAEAVGKVVDATACAEEAAMVSARGTYYSDREAEAEGDSDDSGAAPPPQPE